jgi:hypothetical protein
MSRTLFSIACAALAIAPHAFAVREKPAAPAKEVAPKEETPAVVPPYVLKHRSKFNAPADIARVPFWPVGWSKQKQAAIAVAAVAAPKLTLDEKSFRVTSILISSGTTPSLAVINGRAYGEGEFLRAPKGASVRARIRVTRIDDGTVTLEYEDQKIVTPLRRPELNQHKENEFLDPNR